MSYRWDIERIDQFADIIEHRHAEKLDDFPPADLLEAISFQNGKRLCLIKTQEITEGLEATSARAWAYFKAPLANLDP